MHEEIQMTWNIWLRSGSDTPGSWHLSPPCELKEKFSHVKEWVRSHGGGSWSKSGCYPGPQLQETLMGQVRTPKEAFKIPVWCPGFHSWRWNHGRLEAGRPARELIRARQSRPCVEHGPGLATAYSVLSFSISPQPLLLSLQLAFQKRWGRGLETWVLGLGQGWRCGHGKPQFVLVFEVWSV